MDSFFAKRSRALKIWKVLNGRLSMAKAAIKSTIHTGFLNPFNSLICKPRVLHGAAVRANHHNEAIRRISASIARFFQTKRMRQPKNVEVVKVMLSPSPANPRFWKITATSPPRQRDINCTATSQIQGQTTKYPDQVKLLKGDLLEYGFKSPRLGTCWVLPKISKMLPTIHSW